MDSRQKFRRNESNLYRINSSRIKEELRSNKKYYRTFHYYVNYKRIKWYQRIEQTKLLGMILELISKLLDLNKYAYYSDIHVSLEKALFDKLTFDEQVKYITSVGFSIYSSTIIMKFYFYTNCQSINIMDDFNEYRKSLNITFGIQNMLRYYNKWMYMDSLFNLYDYIKNTQYMYIKIPFESGYMDMNQINEFDIGICNDNMNIIDFKNKIKMGKIDFINEYNKSSQFITFEDAELKSLENEFGLNDPI